MCSSDLDQFVFPFLTGKIITVAPHMHNLGRQIKVEVLDPSGQSTPVIYIDNWDFNWQGFYTLANPMSIKSGSTVRVTSVFDNSAAIPRIPITRSCPWAGASAQRTKWLLRLSA